MRHPALTRLLPVLGCLLAPAPARARPADQAELDQHEERTLARGVERAVRAARSDRALWVKTLEDEFPGKAGNPLKEDEYAAWFDLLVGKGTEWRKDGENSPTAALFDRVVRRLELGPVPSVKRDEFLRYARRVLVQENPRPSDPPPDPNEDADKVFRVLDRDADGVLAAEEFTTKLREDRQRFDADANGRIDKDEYRGYFQKRLDAAVDVATKADDKNGRTGDPKAANRAAAKGGGFPDWLTGLDADKDGQIALHEWRTGGKAIDAFTAMDLDGDGLLTKEEFQRHAKMKEKEQKDREP